MANIQTPEPTKKALRAKFRGRKTLRGKTVPRYPDTAEREYKRVMSAYMRLMNHELKQRLPAVMKEYTRERRGDSRMDDMRDLEFTVREMIRDIKRALGKSIEEFDLERRLAPIARLSKNTTLREWKRAVKSTLGIDLLSEHYNSDFYEMSLRRWVDDNVAKIKSIPYDDLDEMQDIVLDGYRNGRSIRDIQRDIQETYNSDKHKALMLARDQIASLNGQLAEQQQRDAGVSRYMWSTSHDARVRECHDELDGQVFSWDEPPEMWYETKTKGRVYTGRHCHPGGDYACRCVAIPVFDFDTLNIPAEES